MVIMGKKLLIAAAAVFALASAGFGQQCCLTTMFGTDSLKQMLESMGYTNVTLSPNNSCSYYSLSGQMVIGQYTMTMQYKFQVVNTTDLKMTITVSSTMPGYPPTTVDTTMADYCSINVEKGAGPAKGLYPLSAMPNPFSSQISLDFVNPEGRAVLEVFDVKGARVYEMRNIRDSRLTWRPSGLKQGIYLVRVTVSGKAYHKQIICVK